VHGLCVEQVLTIGGNMNDISRALNNLNFVIDNKCDTFGDGVNFASLTVGGNTAETCWPYPIMPDPEIYQIGDPWCPTYVPAFTYYIGNPIKEENVENLYHITVIDLDKNILIDKKVVAKTDDDAKFEAGVFKILQEKKIKPSDVSIIINNVGTVKIGKL